MLIVFAGLPGTGKTTMAKALAARRSAVYVRIDEIEQALRGETTLGPDVGTAGYVVAFAIAFSNLDIGNWVIADSVNPIPETRRGWRKVAQRAKKHLLEIELICSDTQEHRRRVDSRKADIAGFELPSWEAVQQCFYAPWTEPRMVLDTARLGVGDAIGRIDAYIDAIPGQGPAGS